VDALLLESVDLRGLAHSNFWRAIPREALMILLMHMMFCICIEESNLVGLFALNIDGDSGSK
jgi:hypothetical protein